MTSIPMKPELCEEPHDCDRWDAVFKALDVDNDGLIPIAELLEVINESRFVMGLSYEEREILLHNIDRNNDQFIDFAEFTSLMLRVKHMHVHRLMLYAARSVLPRDEQAQITRYLLHYSCCPPPFFMFLISLLQITVYLYYVVESGDGFSLTKPVPVDSPLILNPYRKYEVWRYFTYMFIHIGYMHLVSNVVVQILLGVPLELVHKFWRIALIYLLGVMAGALLFFVVDQWNSRHMFLAGASGGVYALLSAHIANVVINWSEMEFNWLRSAILTVFVGADVCTVLYQKFVEGNQTKVSNISHLGGFIAGLLLGIVILRNLRKLPWEAYAWWISFTLFVFYIIASIFFIFTTPVFV